MHDKTKKYLWALKKLNEALIEGLKMAILMLEKEEGLTLERRKSTIEFLKGFLTQSEEVYREDETSC